MGKLELSVFINRSQQEVFDFLGKYGETQDRKNFEVAKRILEAG